MNNKLYIYIINNKSQAAIVPRPGQFGYPPHLKIGEKTYYKTDRIRYSNESPTGESMIYTEKNHRFNLDDLAGKAPEPESPVVHDEPRRYGVTITYEERGYVEVEAKSEEEAEELAYIAIRDGEVETDGSMDEPDYKYEVEELDDDE